jgi:predicted outer membrane protein
MRNLTRTIAALGLGSLLLAGCGRQESPPAPPSRPAPQPPRAGVLPLSPADYVATASSIDLFVIQASQLAMAQGRSARLREAARTMAADHGGTSGQLSFAGRRLNLLPSATMLPRHQAMFDELRSAADFDAAFKRSMIAVHEQGFRIHGDFAAAGGSPTLRPVAELAFPAMRRHLEMLRGL